jgi:hypothetical protein
MTITERTQIQGSTMAELVDRLAAIDATADHNGGLAQDNLREHHNITDDAPRWKSADLAYGSRWNEYQQ